MVDRMSRKVTQSLKFWILPLDFARGPEPVEGDFGFWIDIHAEDRKDFLLNTEY